MVATINVMPSSDSPESTDWSPELLLDLVALFKTEAAHAVVDSERVRLALEADAIAALHTSAKARAA